MESTIFNIIDMILKALGIEQNPVAFIGLFGLIMARLVPAINYTPFFGGQTVNGRTKIALSVALSFLLYPAMVTVIPSEQIPTKFLTLVLLMIKEAVVGFTLGYVTSLIFYGIEAAGQMLDNMRGANMAQLQSLELGGQVTLLGKLKLQAAIVLFFFLDGHLLYIKGLFYSFERLPVNAYPRLGGSILIGTQLTPIMDDLLRLSSDVLLVSLQLSAPILVCMFLIDIVFGIFNRVAPQINVYFLAIPFKMLISCMMLFLLWAAIVQQMQERFAVYLRIFYTIIEKSIPL